MVTCIGNVSYSFILWIACDITIHHLYFICYMYSSIILLLWCGMGWMNVITQMWLGLGYQLIVVTMDVTQHQSVHGTCIISCIKILVVAKGSWYSWRMTRPILAIFVKCRNVNKGIFKAYIFNDEIHTSKFEYLL